MKFSKLVTELTKKADQLLSKNARRQAAVREALRVGATTATKRPGPHRYRRKHSRSGQSYCEICAPLRCRLA